MLHIFGPLSSETKIGTSLYQWLPLVTIDYQELGSHLSINSSGPKYLDRQVWANSIDPDQEQSAL